MPSYGSAAHWETGSGLRHQLIKRNFGASQEHGLTTNTTRFISLLSYPIGLVEEDKGEERPWHCEEVDLFDRKSTEWEKVVEGENESYERALIHPIPTDGQVARRTFAMMRYSLTKASKGSKLHSHEQGKDRIGKYGVTFMSELSII